METQISLAIFLVASLLLFFHLKRVDCEMKNFEGNYAKSFGMKLNEKPATITTQLSSSLFAADTNKNASKRLATHLSPASSVKAASLSSAERDLDTAADSYFDTQGHFQYSRVPQHGSWEQGYFRGNPHHFKEQHEQAKGHRFRSKLRWGDKHGGYGEHYWDYNHGPKNTN